MQSTNVVLAIAACAVLTAASPLIAQQRAGSGFSVASLNGAYGVHESGDGSVAVGLGVIEYDGAGRASRKITVNSPDGQGGRRLLVFESTGTYTVNPDGTGTATFINSAPNPGAVDTFDLVVTGSAVLWLPERGHSRVAVELFAAQRESGVTVSLVTSLQKRIADVAH